EALRTLGNIAFDLDQHDAAIAHYQRYLEHKPDDLSVQTDMGTMYLSKGDFARAVRIYDAILKTDPKFFQAQFNLAIAYRSAGQNDAAIGALQRAKEIAPDDASKQQAERLIARLQGAPGMPPVAPGGAGAPPPAAEAPGGPANFREAVELIFKQHQILASKVQRFEWQSDTNAKLYLNDFPVSQMPEGMRSLFLERMKDRLRQQKDKFQVRQPVAIELIDFASGETMETLRE
ncbi:MAG TPA: tetratricopeptide repeat protein, partial [Terriglobales bacterium]|nr:tetratricopeptide repeat protein [Terriglobales bacterium]